jgi:hypothetical protein
MQSSCLRMVLDQVCTFVRYCSELAPNWDLCRLKSLLLSSMSHLVCPHRIIKSVVGNYYPGGIKPVDALILEDFDRGKPIGVQAYDSGAIGNRQRQTWR